MQTRLDVTFRDMSPSPALRTVIERWVARLELHHDQIQHCSVIIEQPHRHHHRGRPICAHIVVTVPGREIAVSHSAGESDAYVAVANAFRALRRQLQDHVRSQRERAA
jgi:ribosomal subunit interface protein